MLEGFAPTRGRTGMYGTGTYSTSDISYARDYASSKEGILKMKVNVSEDKLLRTTTSDYIKMIKEERSKIKGIENITDPTEKAKINSDIQNKILGKYDAIIVDDGFEVVVKDKKNIMLF
jgi:hypothetical protein